MAKGKKKDKTKKEEVPSVSTLQISESSEHAPPAEPAQEEEDYGGLTGGGRKKNKPKKGKTEPVAGTSAEVKETTPPAGEQATTSTLDVAVQPTQPSDDKQKEEEEEDVGLGLGGPRKRNRKKKKTDNVATAQVSEAPKVQQPLQSGGEPSVSQPVVPAPAPASAAGAWRAQRAPLPTPVPQTQAPQPPMQQHQPASQLPMQQQPAPQFIPPASKPIPAGVSQVTEIQQKPSEKPKKTLCLYKIPDKILSTRPLGRVTSVITNYLRMTIQPLKIQRYDVSFKPDRPKKLLNVAYNEVIRQNFKNIPIGFDQRKNLYAYNYLPGVSMEERAKFNITIKDSNGKDFSIEVSFKFTGTVDLSNIIAYMKNGGTSLNPPTEAIQAVDVILRQGTLESYVKAGRQFFKRPSRPIDLGEGLEMWTGLFQSAIFTSSPFLNIDVAHKGFPKHQLLIDTFLKDFRLDASRPLEEQRGRSVEAFEHYLKTLKVQAYIGGDLKGPQREFICNGLVAPANRLTFTMKEGTGKEVKISVAAYFEKEKKVRLRYPNVNCVWVGPKDKNIFYPMELLLVSYGQVSNKQMTEIQLSTLVKESATPPDDRKRKIEEVIKDMNYSRNDFFKRFGLTIGNEFVKVDAKILTPPKLEVGGTAVEPRRGAWQAKRLFRAQALDSWGFIAVDTDPRNRLDNVIGMIMDIGSQMGMSIKNPMFTQFSVRIQDMMQTLQMARDKGVNFVFVVLSARGRDYYHKLKRAAEREVGVLTQCIKEFTATRKMNESTVRNIMLKVNSKLMGINHALDNRSIPQCLQSGKTMLVGADVTHPSPDQTSIPSIAAVTASIDPKFSIYNITLSIQTPKKEMIVDFENMMLEHLQEFQRRHRDLPGKIYVFRDGVSEGQFAEVMNSELQALLNAYKRQAGPNGKRPEVLFILVQKRHHTRLFVPGTNANVEPGTVVDTQIVHPRELDFYLVSHQAIKGTARPTRYHAVCNDGRISQDEVEQLTFYLCHLYARCTRSVSYPTPTYYAHLACMRARSLTFGDRFCNADLERQPQRLRVLERMLQNSRMFFV